MIWHLDYLMKFSLTEVLLLKENHTNNESFSYVSNIKITLCENIEKCLYNSDICIVVKDDDIPESSINRLLNLSIKYEKKCYILKNPFKNNLYSAEKINQYFQKIEVEKQPVILNISLGYISQSYAVEILIDKIFNNHNIFVKHFYTNHTYSILQQLNNNELLKSDISKRIFRNEGDNHYNAIICSVNIGENLKEISSYMDLFRKIKADYTILQTDRNFDDDKIVKNILLYGCFTNIEMIIKSHYIKTNQDNFVYCNSTIYNNNIIKDLELDSLESDLCKGMFSKISLPSGMLGLF